MRLFALAATVLGAVAGQEDITPEAMMAAIAEGEDTGDTLEDMVYSDDAPLIDSELALENVSETAPGAEPYVVFQDDEEPSDDTLEGIDEDATDMDAPSSGSFASRLQTMKIIKESRNSMSWNDAKAKCASVGMEMAAPMTIDELKQLTGQFKAAGGKHKLTVNYSLIGLWQSEGKQKVPYRNAYTGAAVQSGMNYSDNQYRCGYIYTGSNAAVYRGKFFEYPCNQRTSSFREVVCVGAGREYARRWTHQKQVYSSRGYTWSEAYKYCNSLHMRLPTPVSNQEVTVTANQFNNHGGKLSSRQNRMWVGLRQSAYQQPFKNWYTGQVLDKGLQYGDGNSNSHGGYHCGFVYYGKGTYDTKVPDYYCDYRHSAWNTINCLPPPSPIYEMMSSRHIGYSASGFSWLQAKAYCDSKGLQLVAPNTKADVMAINSQWQINGGSLSNSYPYMFVGVRQSGYKQPYRNAYTGQDVSSILYSDGNSNSHGGYNCGYIYYHPSSWVYRTKVIDYYCAYRHSSFRYAMCTKGQFGQATCPNSYWEYDQKQNKCRPKTGNVKLTCGTTGMALSVHSGVFGGDYKLGSCTGKAGSTANFSYKSCGMKRTTPSGNVMYEVTLSSPAIKTIYNMYPGVKLRCVIKGSDSVSVDFKLQFDYSSFQRDSELEGTVSCGAGKKEEIQKLEKSIAIKSRTSAYMVGSNVNFAITSSQAVANLKVELTSCIVSSLSVKSASPNIFSTDTAKILKSNKQSSSSGAIKVGDLFTASYMGFRFTGEATEFKHRVTCEIKVSGDCKSN